jgi:hypothetical protein
MLRDQWKFDYPAAQVAEAAAARSAYHSARLKFWKERREIVLSRIRSEGLEIDESAAVGFRNPKARDWEQGTHVTVRPDLRQDLEECSAKLGYHAKELEQYGSWQQTMAANADKTVSLDIEDWVYFFGKR